MELIEKNISELSSYIELYNSIKLYNSINLHYNISLCLEKDNEHYLERLNDITLKIKNFRTNLNNCKDSFKLKFQSNVLITFCFNKHNINIEYILNENKKLFVHFNYFDNNITFDLGAPTKIEEMQDFEYRYSLFKKDLELYNDLDTFKSLHKLFFNASDTIKKLEILKEEYSLNYHLIKNKNKFKLHQFQNIFKYSNFKSVEDYINYFGHIIEYKPKKLNFVTYKFCQNDILFSTYHFTVHRDEISNNLIYNLNGKIVNDITELLNQSFSIGNVFISTKNELNRLGFRLNNKGKQTYCHLIDALKLEMQQHRIEDF